MTTRIALVTGAHGFIGRHLARTLALHGYRVVGLGHGNWPETEARAWGVSHWLNGDITPANLRGLQQQVGTPEVIYHLAGGSSVGLAIANPREDFFRTVATTAELLEWMRQDAPSASIVAVSSAAVYGAGREGRIAEDVPLNPYSPYGHHKRLMEELCRSYAASYGTRVVIARLFSVYGAELKKQLLWDLCTRLSAGANPLVLGGTGNELRDWTEIADVCRALVLLNQAFAAEPRIVNIGQGLGTSVQRVASELVRAWGDGEATPAALSFTGQARAGDPFSLIAAPERLKSMGFEWQVRLDDGLAAYARWFRSLGLPLS